MASNGSVIDLTADSPESSHTTITSNIVAGSTRGRRSRAATRGTPYRHHTAGQPNSTASTSNSTRNVNQSVSVPSSSPDSDPHPHPRPPNRQRARAAGGMSEADRSRQRFIQQLRQHGMRLRPEIRMGASPSTVSPSPSPSPESEANVDRNRNRDRNRGEGPSNTINRSPIQNRNRQVRVSDNDDDDDSADDDQVFQDLISSEDRGIGSSSNNHSQQSSNPVRRSTRSRMRNRDESLSNSVPIRRSIVSPSPSPDQDQVRGIESSPARIRFASPSPSNDLDSSDDDEIQFMGASRRAVQGGWFRAVNGNGNGNELPRPQVVPGEFIGRLEVQSGFLDLEVPEVV